MGSLGPCNVAGEGSQTWRGGGVGGVGGGGGGGGWGRWAVWAVGAVKNICMRWSPLKTSARR